MTKEEIEFMLKSGFSINEIMAVQNKPETKEDEKNNEPDKDEIEDKNNEPNKDDKNNEPDEEETELVQTLKAELNKLRKERQKMNRKKEVIQKLPEEKTSEQILSESIIKIYEDSQK